MKQPRSEVGKAAYERMARRRYLPLKNGETLWDRLESLFPGDPEYDAVLAMIAHEWGVGAVAPDPTLSRDPPAGWGAHCPVCGQIWDQPLNRADWVRRKGKPLLCVGCRLDTYQHK